MWICLVGYSTNGNAPRKLAKDVICGTWQDNTVCEGNASSEKTNKTTAISSLSEFISSKEFNFNSCTALV